MKKAPDRDWTTAATLFALSVICILAHFSLVPIALNLLHSDFGPGPLVANDFRNGHWSAFYYQLSYGGTTLAPLRALFCAIWEMFSQNPLDYIDSQMTFTFVVTPLLMCWSVYFLVRAYCSRLSATVVGAIAAVGFQYWITQFGNDVYFCYLILGSALLAWRARVKNPWLDLSDGQLFLAGALTGLMVYTSRASMIYAVAFFLPASWAIGEAKSLLKPKDGIQKTLVYSAVFLIGFFFYLEIFGPNLGTWNGRNIKLHADPNLRYGIFVLALAWIRVRCPKLSPQVIQRSATLLAGLVLGFLPEIVHWIGRNKAGAPSMSGTLGIQDAFHVLGMVPSSLRELMTGNGGYGENQAVQLFSGGGQIFLNASVLMLMGGIYFLIQKMRKDDRFEAIAVTAGLSIVAYCRIMTYTYGTARYLLPITPVLFVAIGCFWDQVALSKKNSTLVAALVLVLTHLGYQLHARHELIEAASQSGRAKQVFEIVRLFKDQNLSIVISNDYWHANQYSFVSNLNPIFVATSQDSLIPPEGLVQVQHVPEAGILLEARIRLPDGAVYEALGRKWKLHYLKEIGDRVLYRGVAS